MLLPPPLEPDALITIVAPSGPFDEDLLRLGVSRLEDFRCEWGEDTLKRRHGFLAGTDAQRLSELQAALDCPESGAVLVARGGYGLARLLDDLNFDGLKRYPKWVMGFSDATALHLSLLNQGLHSLHCANGTTLARSTPSDLSALRSILSGESRQEYSALEKIVGGRAQGRLFGGNLTVLFAEAASNRLHVPPGALLFLEDVTETSYRIDRMLTALRRAGHFRQISGILLGEFLDCSSGKFDVSTEQVLTDNLVNLRVPLLRGLGVGHGERNAPLIFGAQGSMNADKGTLSVGTPHSDD